MKQRKTKKKQKSVQPFETRLENVNEMEVFINGTSCDSQGVKTMSFSEPVN